MADQKAEATASTEMPVARIVNLEGRSKTVPLEYPVEFAGAVWDSIEIRRCTGQEIADYFNRMSQSATFVMPPVIQCPVEVWQALDADDQDTIDEAAQAFMPRRLKAAVELLSETGANMSGK